MSNSKQNSSEVHWIDDPKSLRAFCQRIEGSSWLAIDTEFIRETTYYPRLCLLQIASETDIGLIDILALEDLRALTEVVYSESTVKIFHAARQDLEIFQMRESRLPVPVFDTQVAAALLGMSEQISYAELTHQILGIRPPKLHTRTDWSRRPLPQGAIEYAADDVRYLGEIYEFQRAALEKQEKVSWMDEEMVRLTDSANYIPDAEQAWQRVSGIGRLRPRSQRVAAALAAWREELAMTSDRPRKRIVRDDVLLELARRMPRDAAGVAKIKGAEQLAVADANALLPVIATIRDASDSDTSTPLLGDADQRLSDEQALLVDFLIQVGRVRATELGVSPGFAITRKEVDKLVRGDTSTNLHRGWRKDAVGATLTDFLSGELCVRLQDGHWLIDTHSVA